MKMHSIHRGNDKGAALLLLVIALSFAFTTLLIGLIGGRNASKARADTITRDVLRDAKEALITAAISVNGDQGDVSNTYRPGELPCPDRHVPKSANEGRAGSDTIVNCKDNPDRIGRIPWWELGLSRYKDGHGETLWYILAADFRSLGTKVELNSNTPGDLKAYGNLGRTALSTNAVAIIISPGALLTGQNRDDSAPLDPVNYLDSITLNGIVYSNQNSNVLTRHLNGPVTCTDLPADPACGGKPDNSIVLFNDQLEIITQNELMSRVRQRAAREYSLAISRRGLSSNCPSYPLTTIASIPIPVNMGDPPADTYNWLGANWWDNTASGGLRYKTCTPLVMQ